MMACEQQWWPIILIMIAKMTMTITIWWQVNNNQLVCISPALSSLTNLEVINFWHLPVCLLILNGQVHFVFFLSPHLKRTSIFYTFPASSCKPHSLQVLSIQHNLLQALPSTISSLDRSVIIIFTISIPCGSPPESCWWSPSSPYWSSPPPPSTCWSSPPSPPWPACANSVWIGTGCAATATSSGSPPF